MKLKKLVVVFLLSALASGCRHDPSLPEEQPGKIRLRWIPAFDEQRRADMETGLAWSLSYLGALLPEGSLAAAIRYEGSDSTRFELDLGNVGFSEAAYSSITTILRRMKASEEYRQRGAISLGRFLMLTLHSSWHYYEITGMPESLEAFWAENQVGNIFLFPVLQSTVGLEHRFLKFQISEDPGRMAFLAEDTDGDIATPGYPVHGYEVFDVMPNGQLRFAIYDAAGQLAPAAPANRTRAGKPSKCLWCHESKVQPLFAPSPDIDGFMTAQDFYLLTDSANHILDWYRSRQRADIQFSRRQDHTQSEFLYISFMEPSVRVVAREWGWNEEEVEARFQGFPSHVHGEFPQLGALYHRRRVDSLGPYQTLRVPDSAREPNAGEPDFFR